jgi:hypothetical protein
MGPITVPQPSGFDLVLGVCYPVKIKILCYFLQESHGQPNSSKFACDYATLFDLHRKERWIGVLKEDLSGSP